MDLLEISKMDIPADWVPHTGPRDAAAAKKAKRIRAVKTGGKAAAAATGLGLGAIAASRALRKPAAEVAQTATRTSITPALGAVAGGGLLAGAGGSLALKHRKKETA